MESQGFETRAIHAGQEPDPLTGAVIPPIYQTSTFKQDGVGGLREGYEYSRSANPTRTALEENLASIESGNFGFAFASGLAAEDTLLRTVLRPGDHIVIPNDAYGGTFRLIARVLKEWGVSFSSAPVDDLDASKVQPVGVVAVPVDPNLTTIINKLPVIIYAGILIGAVVTADPADV